MAGNSIVEQPSAQPNNEKMIVVKNKRTTIKTANFTTLPNIVIVRLQSSICFSRELMSICLVSFDESFFEHFNAIAIVVDYFEDFRIVTDNLVFVANCDFIL